MCKARNVRAPVWGAVACVLVGSLVAVAVPATVATLGATEHAPVILGFGTFLSYGLLLLGVFALTLVGLARSWKALGLAVCGALAVVLAFAVAGFWWFEGYQLVVERYYQGVAAKRPYWYWVWANLAGFALLLGPALIAGARRSVALGVRGSVARPGVQYQGLVSDRGEHVRDSGTDETGPTGDEDSHPGNGSACRLDY